MDGWIPARFQGRAKQTATKIILPLVGLSNVAIYIAIERIGRAGDQLHVYSALLEIVH